MPELPEVETTKRGIMPHLADQTIERVVVRQSQLRWPVTSTLNDQLTNQKLLSITRRGKYLLLKIHQGTLLIHLGMSGSLRILETTVSPQKHDHIDIVFKNGKTLRYTDPRRFGAFLWVDGNPLLHPLLSKLGVEPLESCFTSTYLLTHAQRRTLPIKSFIMDHHIVVGIGNIYATEALFLAKIHPLTPANTLSQKQMEALTSAIGCILNEAIQQGGTTLKDFVNTEGKPGYFFLKLKVYGRAGQPCVVCHSPLETLRIGQRATVYCSFCQQ